MNVKIKQTTGSWCNETLWSLREIYREGENEILQKTSGHNGHSEDPGGESVITVHYECVACGEICHFDTQGIDGFPDVCYERLERLIRCPVPQGKTKAQFYYVRKS